MPCTDSLRAAPPVSFELKLPVELNSFSENEFNSTESFNSKETVGAARRLCTDGIQILSLFLFFTASWAALFKHLP